MNAIADTGFLVAFGNRNDLHHEWAVQLAHHVVEPLLTCEAVLAETTFHLGDATLVLGFISSGLVGPTFILADHTPQIAQLAKRYRDRLPDLADFVSHSHERTASETLGHHNGSHPFPSLPAQQA